MSLLCMWAGLVRYALFYAGALLKFERYVVYSHQSMFNLINNIFSLSLSVYWVSNFFNGCYE